MSKVTVKSVYEVRVDIGKDPTVEDIENGLAAFKAEKTRVFGDMPFTSRAVVLGNPFNQYGPDPKRPSIILEATAAKL